VIAAGPGTLRVGSVVDLDAGAVAILDLLPDRVRLREEHAGVDREDARLRLDLHDHVDQNRLFLLEGAGEHEPGVEALDGLREDFLRCAVGCG
jgi:hypothetical protein